MKVTFLIRALTHGGAERQLVLLAKGLASKGHDVSIVVFYGGAVFEKDLRSTNVSLVNLNKKSRWDIFPFLWRVLKYFRSNKPDILHGYLTFSNILVILLKPFLKDSCIVLGIRASNMNLDNYNWLEGLTYKIQCKLSRYADYAISNSYAGKTYAVNNGFPVDKMIVIHNGIDINFFKYNSKLRKKCRDEWEISPEQILIGIVGRLDPMKGHRVFIQAASQLVKINKKVRFICIGDGDDTYKKELQLLVKKHRLEDVFIWAGSRSDMVAIYSALDIVTSSSIYGEGFPNVVGEAMSCGKECVVTDVGDSKIIVNTLGEVIPIDNENALENAWQNIIAKNYQPSNEAIRKNIVSNYSIETMVTKTEKVFHG